MLPSFNLADARRSRFGAVLWAVSGKCIADNISGAAAAIAFFSVLAAFPGLGAVVSVYGLFADPAVIEQHINFLVGLLPAAMVRLLSSDLQSFLQFQHQHLGIALVVSLFFAVTCGRTSVASLIYSLNAIYGSKDSRRIVHRQGVGLALVAGILAFVAITFALVALTPLIIYYIVPLSRGWRHAIDYLRWPLMALMMVTSLSRLYQLAPHKSRHRPTWFGWGPTIATLLWLIFSVGYSLYLGQVGSYNVIYGSVSSTIVLLIWLYLSGLAVLIGAEIDAFRREHHSWSTASPTPRTPSG